MRKEIKVNSQLFVKVEEDEETMERIFTLPKSMSNGLPSLGDMISEEENNLELDTEKDWLWVIEYK